MDPKMKEILDRLAEFEGKAAKLASDLEAASSADDIKSVKDELTDARAKIDSLLAEKADRQAAIERDELTSQVKALSERMEASRDLPGSIFGDIKGGEGKSAKDGVYGQVGGHSFFGDVKAAKMGNPDAYDRLSKVAGEWGDDAKAMTEGTDSAGGYLVNPEISDEVISLRLAASAVRPLCSKINVNSDSLQIASLTGGLTAGWVAELAAKPETDMTFGSLTVNNFTMAGLGAVSNQLLADSRPSVDKFIVADLAKRLAILEETAFINGSGTGQPRGILQTSGINSVVYTDASPTAEELLDALYDAIAAVQQNYFGEPNGVLMHPRTWQYLSKARSTLSGLYVIGSGANANGRNATDNLPGRSVFGVPVYLSNLIPTDLGGGTESAIIVGDFSQALILDRMGLTVDTSDQVRFTTNQTVFRVEARVGFTAARYPKAFAAVTGTGLAGK